MNEFIASLKDQNLRLDAFILTKFPDFSRSNIKNQIEKGLILVNGKIVKAGEKIKEKDIITVELQEPKELEVIAQNIDIDIIYEDDDLAVINKPKGMVVHPANGNDDGTLVNALLYHLKNLSGINGVIRPGIVHRLDKDTSGLLIVAKNDKAHISLAKQIETKLCHRYYKALCVGNFKEDQGVIKTGYGRSLKDRKQMAVFPLGQGKEAITEYNVIKRYNGYTLVEFKLQTGRTHQIRVHSKYMHHPIVCDEVYGVSDKNFKGKGQLLHAYKIEFEQPSTGEWLTFECELPNNFNDALEKLERMKKII